MHLILSNSLAHYAALMAVKAKSWITSFRILASVSPLITAEAGFGTSTCQAHAPPKAD